MSGYLRSKIFETTFDGDHVRVKLKPLLFSDLIKFKSTDGDPEKTTALFQEILPAYTDEFTGLSDAAGSPILIDEACSTVYFVDLILLIGLELIKGSSVSRPQKPVEPSALQ